MRVAYLSLIAFLAMSLVLRTAGDMSGLVTASFPEHPAVRENKKRQLGNDFIAWTAFSNNMTFRGA